MSKHNIFYGVQYTIYINAFLSNVFSRFGSSYYYLFHLKGVFYEKRFCSNEEVIAEKVEFCKKNDFMTSVGVPLKLIISQGIIKHILKFKYRTGVGENAWRIFENKIMFTQ